ncbi:MAG TPA: NAD(P)/FAD-dependent oxidoreductase [Ignavibacteria bacterium]|nr:NAD(P)/FAD-dependent oxidoreductase [Ignavibacteria bacterium]
MTEKEVVIIGGGAAGLMCAIEAGKRGRNVLVIEHCEKIGKKILISGGGRCNFTNKNVFPDNFISQNPHFCKSALSRFTPDDFISMIEKHNISYHEKKLGQLFCDESSRQIVSMLETECKNYGVKIITNCEVKEIVKDKFFDIETNKEKFQSESLVIASGGISIPKMGATDFGYKIAEKFNIGLTEIYPALVPFTFSGNDKKMFAEISGVSIDSEVSCNGVTFRENILFTHKGMSGPAILQISSYWNKGDSISLNILPDINFYEILKENSKSKIELVNFFSNYFPKRFAQAFTVNYFPSRPLINISDKDLKLISDKIHNWILNPSGTEGYDKAEVTTGGVDTNELSSKTMESKKVKGLYFIGEVVDVTGWLGGYNFQWAWSSGFAAGQFV